MTRAQRGSAGHGGEAHSESGRGTHARTVAPQPPWGQAVGDGREQCDDGRERLRFDTLFAEPRHFRSDCQLVRKAIRHGWIRPEDGEALGARLSEAMQIAERNGRARHQLAIAFLILAVVRAEVEAGLESVCR